MLFNSYVFIFAFLPIVIGVFAILQKFNRARMMTAWLVIASIFFYGWWNPAYLLLIGLSIGVNFFIGRQLSIKPSKPTLITGIAFNLGLLGYFKYAMFFAGAVGYDVGSIILPLAISFFTFQQITYLIDANKGATSEYNFLDYCLFVTFFPQLIAGPIVHHKDMMPQFADKKVFGITIQNIGIGLTFFIIGLFKKLVIADEIATYATPVFNAADAGGDVYFIEAWIGALSYTFQLYFDFSGYSDMAIGLARIFGIQLPLNFFSPYKSASIIDFWRRWHITLSHFLRDYLYIPLGGNRKGTMRRYTNLLTTMILGGLWHGAGWNFIIWGALHGLYLMINNGWRSFCLALSIKPFAGLLGQIIAIGITFISVVFSWVFFRATTLDGALSMCKSMLGLNGISLPRAVSEHVVTAFNDIGFETFTMGVLPILNSKITEILFVLLPVMAIAFIAPNTAQFMRRTLRNPASKDFADLNRDKLIPIVQKLMPVWRAHFIYGLLMAGLATIAVLSMTRISEFLYFQF
ncbi:MAG: membrane-bound O-acyltransferase family protein [Alphaproteobacteria bacterium]|nr:MAG: membrane-bound O-acyltransferase family protein [Alphaproteobacteria bacterium]